MMLEGPNFTQTCKTILHTKFGMDFELPYGIPEEELIDTNELVDFKENN